MSSVPNVTQESCSAKVPGAQLGNELRNDAAKGNHLFVDDAGVACVFQISVGEGMLVAFLRNAVEDRTEEYVIECCLRSLWKIGISVI